MAFYGCFSRGNKKDFSDVRELKNILKKKVHAYADSNIHFFYTGKENFLEHKDGFIYIEGNIFSHMIENFLALYHKSGIESFKCLSGEFFMILYDKRKEKLFLVSDRRGSRKCYYILENNTVLFSSYMKALMNSVEACRFNRDAMMEFLVFGVAISPHTFVLGVNQSKFSEIIEMSSSHDSLAFRKISYFDDTMFIHRFPKDSNLMMKYVFDTYKKSVEERIGNCKSVDILSSGGIDSAVLVYLASLANCKINTHTIGYEEESVDERRYARLLSSFFGTNHKDIVLKSELVKLSPLIVWHEEGPHQSVRNLLNFSLNELTKNRDVVLSGEGIENQFLTGFDYDLVFYLNKADFFLRFGKAFPIKIWCYMHYAPAFYNLLSKTTLENLEENILGSDILKKYNLFKFRIWDVEYVGTFQKASEAFNNQVLFPFLDERCFKLYSLPDNLRKEKFLFSRTFARYIPEEIVKRKKMKIVSPSEIWLKEQSDLIMEFVRRFEKRNLISKDMLVEYLNTKIPNYDRHFWSVFSLEIFLETFFNKRNSTRPVKNLGKLL